MLKDATAFSTRKRILLGAGNRHHTQDQKGRSRQSCGSNFCQRLCWRPGSCFVFSECRVRSPVGFQVTLAAIGGSDWWLGDFGSLVLIEGTCQRASNRQLERR